MYSAAPIVPVVRRRAVPGVAGRDFRGWRKRSRTLVLFAALVALGRVLILGGCLADLYLPHGLRHSRSGCRRAERKRRAGEHHAP